jgi:choline dehydrogenase-like flavoprotein
MSTTNHADAIVIGSGITGGWAAKELCEKGLQTLVLERGPLIEHGKSYITEHKPDYWFPFRGMNDRRRIQRDQAVQSTAEGFSEANAHFFINDRLNPYTHDPDKPFAWIRGSQLGGKSLTWYRQCYRWSDLDFTANQRDGIAADWPIRYADIAPWYDYVESYIGVSGRADQIPQLPDGPFLPPMPNNVVERHVETIFAERFPDRKTTPGRTATLTRPHNGRGQCHMCGPCSRGCSVGAYFSSLSSTLPAARATGRLTIRTNSIVHSIIYDAKTHRVTGVQVIDAVTRRTTEYFAKVIFVCASALESVRLLLNSTSAAFPDGLANGSGILGTHIMDHQWGIEAAGELPDLPREGGYPSGYRPSVMMIPRFRNVTRREQTFTRGYQTEYSGTRVGWQRGLGEVGLGAALKGRLKELGPWNVTFDANGECLPYADNKVRLNKSVVDAWGIPVLHFSMTYRENEAKMRADMAVAMAEMAEAVGARNIRVIKESRVPGISIHEMGGARMGRDARTSVLNAHNQAHDIPNLFVTDGASMASSGNQNPSLTYMALTARACAYAVEQLKDRKI